ncbi:MAG: DoxX family protein [Thermogemmatispora sp.]|uniref:DoxX family protein n=1 Tax=Thermogemmatispora sp. TaxID=1968838 RepID=UPI00261785D6|nr:DoxX family protein [Thermogemmatispora sp.]MBX5456656.1 DoxX family protein [Thermogemmatispora sp.]
MIRALARLLLAVIFIKGGADTFLNPGGRPARVARFGIAQPERAVVLNGATMVVAGSALALGWFPRLAAAVLLAVLVPTTIVGHPFWQESDPQTRQMQQNQFAKNLGLMGGLLLVLLEESRTKAARSRAQS